MSFTQMSEKLLKLTHALQNCFTAKSNSVKSNSGQKEQLKARKLQIDALEERQMLSISVGNSYDIQINQIDLATVLPNYPYAQTQALAGNNQSTASNNWGDFVTTYAQEEPAWRMREDENGNLVHMRDEYGNYVPYIDPITRQPVMESNIYARYFTDEVQHVTLPMELLKPDNGYSKSTFSMEYGGNVVQKLTFSTALFPDYNPFSSYGYYYDPDTGYYYYYGGSGDQQIRGTFMIGGIDANDNGRVESQEWIMFEFNESKGAVQCAKELQTALRGLGPYMSKVVVTPINSREYEIEFADSFWHGKDVPELQITNQSFSSGFMAGGVITTVNTPIDIVLQKYDYDTNTIVSVGIPIYTPTAQQWSDPAGNWKSNPYWVQATQKTGDAIIAAFRQYWVSNWEVYAPIFTDAYIVQQNFQMPDVAVTVINPWTYEVTFINSSGKINHPELLVSSAVDAAGKEYIDRDSIDLYDYYRYVDGSRPVQTIKETSDAFRVNPLEPDDPWTPHPDTTYQYKPVVAMDADGDFIIAWETEANTPTLNRWNIWDINAQRFTTQAVLPVTPENLANNLYSPYGKTVQGIRPVGDAIKVNSMDNGIQTDPTIACDQYGNFVVGWSTYGQTGSYFAGIQGKWFDRNGNALTGDVHISGYIDPITGERRDRTDTPHLATVGMSDDGYTVFAWAETRIPGDVYKSVFLPGNYNNPIVDAELAVSRAYQPSISFTSTTFDPDPLNPGTFIANTRYLLTYTTPYDWLVGEDAVNRMNDGHDVYGQLYVIHPNGTETVDRGDGGAGGPMRLNSATTPNFITPTYRSQQYDSSAGIDADGDIFVTWQGFLPDPDAPYGTAWVSFGVDYNEHFQGGKNADLVKYVTYLDGVDPDSAIRDALIRAQHLGASQEQLGRLNVIFESTARNLRAGSIGLTSFDADLRTTSGDWTYGINYFDAIPVNYRDGNNQKFIIAIPAYHIESGSINLDVYRDEGQFSLVQRGIGIGLAVHSESKSLLVGDTARNIRDSINSAWIFGRTYAEGSDYLGPTCVVEAFFHDDLVAARTGTAWEFPAKLPDYWYVADSITYTSDAYWCFEVTLIGGAHDTNFEIFYNGDDSGEIKLEGVDARSTPSVIPSYGYYYLDVNGNITTNAYQMVETLASSPYGSTAFIDELGGVPGTGQIGSSIIVSKSGDYSIVWAQESASIYQTRYRVGHNESLYSYDTRVGIYGTYRNFLPANLYFRHFVESTDTAGPTITDYYLPDGTSILSSDPIVYLPDGTSRQTGEQVTTALKELVVTFDEEMRDVARDAYHGIDNVKNWVLLKDGVPVANAIESIIFGLNASQVLAQNSSVDAVNSGTLALGTGKWEAIIRFNETSVNNSLGSGQYTLIAKNTLADIAGNVLNRTGNKLTGHEMQFVFNVSVMDGYLGFDEGDVDDSSINSFEYVVNGSQNNDGSPNRVDGFDPQDGKQYFREDLDPKHYPVDNEKETGGTTVASDAEGNFAVVWASSDPGNEGIFLRKYRTRTVYGLEGFATVEDTMDTIRLSNNPTAMHPSVAMDPDGDIVVCWSEENLVDGLVNRDVYFKYVYQADGKLQAGTRFLANTEQEYIQQHPVVAMSNDGDFVITWESEYQDGSGWGVFAQRFAPDCSKLGGLNCVQDLMIAGAPSGGTFQLRYTLYEGDVALIWETRAITIKQNTFDMEIDIQRALEDMTGYRLNNGVSTPLANRKLDVEVKVISMSRILIEFVGEEYGNQQQPQLVAFNSKFDNPKPGMSITTLTSVAGNSGEFQVNLTTEYDQRFPSIAMGAQGEFVITWTGWSPVSGANTLQTDVYARKFVSSSSLRVTGTQTNMQATQTDATPLIYSNDDPANHIVQAGQGYDGVCYVEIFSQVWGGWSGSGTLLSSGLHVLTAAHVVADPLFGNALAAGEVFVTFDTINGPLTMRAAQVIVHPTYRGLATFDATSDIAIIQLEALAPSSIQRYDIYRGRDELGKIVTQVGYGYSGRANDVIYSDGLKRAGTNTYDLTSRTVSLTMHPELLIFDFDDGTRANDIIGNLYGVRHLGTGWANEVNTANGDSGGPGFIDGKIAGVTSGGFGLGNEQPGGVSFDVRVSGYADWIDAILSGGGQEILVNQTTVGDQLWSDVAIDAAGNFVVTWTQSLPGSGGGILPDAYSIMARRFSADGYALAGWGNEFLVSSSIAQNSTDQHQLMSKISMTPQGDFVIAWEGLTNRSNPGSTTLDFDILARRYVNSRSLQTIHPITSVIEGYGLVGANGEMTTPFYVNRTTEKDQRAAGVALDSTGDMVVVWNGYSDQAVKKYNSATGEEIIDNHNIMYRRITVPKDISAPFVTDVVAAVKNSDKPYDYDLTQIIEGTTLEKGPNVIIVTMSEEVFSQNVIDSRSIRNPANWAIYYNGYILPEAIKDIGWVYVASSYIPEKDITAFDPLVQGRNSAYECGIIPYKSGKIEVVLTLDGDLSQEGLQGLLNGEYTLVFFGNVEDIREVRATTANKLDGTYDGLSGGNFQRTFYVGDTSLRPLDPGDDPTFPTDPVDPTNPMDDPQAFHNMSFVKSKPAIAYRPDGSFVVVAVEDRYGVDTEDPNVIIQTSGLDIIARLYDKNGVPIGYERIVNNYVVGDQTDPHVSMDKFGNFVVVWSGPGEFAGTSGIHARVFDAFGNPVASSFQLSQSSSLQMTPKVALNDDGTFVVTWIGYDQATRGQVVFARVFAFSGLPVGDSFIIAKVAGYNCYEVDIACDHNGNYGVTWSAYDPDAKSTNVFAQTFRVDSKTGNHAVIVGTFRVNTIVNRDCTNPSIAMSGVNGGQVGNFVIAWEGNDVIDPKNDSVTGLEVFARAFTSNGSSIKMFGSTNQVRINQYAKGNQLDPAVSFSNDGSTIAFTWSSYDQEFYNYDPNRQMTLHDYGVWARVLKLGANGFADPTNYKAGEFQVNRIEIGNQESPAIAMGEKGDYSIVWVGPYNSVDAALIPVLDLKTNIYIRSYRPNGVTTLSASPSYSYSSNALTVKNSASTLVEKRDGLNQFGSTHVRPSGGGYMNYDASLPNGVSTVFVINGTSGNDILSVTPGSTSGSWNVRLNGTTQNIPKGTTEIVFNGGAGKNDVVLTGTSGRDDVILNATTQTLIFASLGINLRVHQVTTADLDGAGGDDSIQLTTSAGNDTVDLSVASLIFTGSGLTYTAKNFERANVLSGGGKDIAVMRTSKDDDDALEMSPNHAKMTGKGYTHEVSGFHSITAFSEGGNDTVVFTGSTFKDVLTASEDNVVLGSTNDAYFNRVKGFRDVTVNTKGGGNVATIDGSRYGSDRLNVFENGAQMLYDNGSSLRFNGFQNATISAGNGFSTAQLTGGSRFVGYDDYCSYVAGDMKVTLNRFDSTVVHAMPGTTSQAVLNVGGNVTATIKTLGRTTTLNENGVDLYSLIAFEQIYAKKAKGITSGVLQSVADNLFATGDWE